MILEWSNCCARGIVDGLNGPVSLIDIIMQLSVPLSEIQPNKTIPHRLILATGWRRTGIEDHRNVRFDVYSGESFFFRYEGTVRFSEQDDTYVYLLWMRTIPASHSEIHFKIF